MNSFAVITFVACLAAVNASWIHSASPHVLQGLSSRTTLVGFQGRVISTHAAPVHARIVAHAAPVPAHHARIVAYRSPVVAHSAPATVVAHSSAYGQDDVVVAGPSGTIATGHAARAVAHAAPIVAPAVPVVAYSAPILAHGHARHYVHHHSELYDDGSYKAHLYHH